MSQSEPRRYANPRREIPGETPEIARLSAMVVALLQELAITRERLDTVERLLDSAGLVPRDSVEGYRATSETAEERDAIRKRLIGVVMQPLKDAAARARELADQEHSRAEADAILGREIS